ncbi:MAG: oligosaccharide flippase family protein [Hungatella sp.]|nr:oligosaccharide flippase family protein [Hungatella sp.]
MRGIYQKFKKAIEDGLLYILTNGFFTQVIAFLSSTIIIRYLPKLEYGNYVNANNLYSYFTVFVGMGFATAVLQFCSESRSQKEKNDIYCFTLIEGTIFNIVLCLIIIILSVFKWGDSAKVGQYLLMMSCLPLFSYFSSYFQVVLRIKSLNREYSFTGMINAVAVFAINILLSRIFGVVSLIISQYAGSIISMVISILYLKKTGNYDISFATARRLDTGDKRSLESYALLGAITNFTSNILVLIDITCLGMISSDPQLLAGYKVASVIPSAMLFISSSMVLYYYPKLVHLYYENLEVFLAELKAIRIMFVIINGVIAFGLFVFAPIIIALLFGNQYKESVGIFRLLCLNYFIFSSYRKLYGNIIALIKKVKVNFVNTALAGILNIVLNFFFINKYGAMGAAVATICVSIFTTAFSIIYFHMFLKKFKSSI